MCMKAIYLVLIAMVLFSLFFGCTQPVVDVDSNVPKLTNQDQVDSTASDVGTDISGINTTLIEIDSALS